MSTIEHLIAVNTQAIEGYRASLAQHSALSLHHYTNNRDTTDEAQERLLDSIARLEEANAYLRHQAGLNTQ